MSDLRDRLRSLVQRNIEDHGRHLYLVQASEVPRYVYTVGMADRGKPELVLAGSTFFSAAESSSILNCIARELEDGTVSRDRFLVEGVGTFSVRAADPSWTGVMMLGALERYGSHGFTALQVVPQEPGPRTLDIPDMKSPRGPEDDPAWRWLVAEWTHSVPRTSRVTTSLAVLRGEPATEAARWEEDEWEIFAGPGPDVDPSEVRVVPLSTLMGIDRTLSRVLELDVGAAVWRSSGASDWQMWGDGGAPP